jgi:uncharacterized membrane protein YgaE (UPF0421/DUF939 family)
LSNTNPTEASGVRDGTSVSVGVAVGVGVGVTEGVGVGVFVSGMAVGVGVMVAVAVAVAVGVGVAVGGLSAWQDATSSRQQTVNRRRIMSIVRSGILA